MFNACLKTEKFPDEPVIELKSFDPLPDGSANLTIQFTDGDGDIGLNPGDTFPPFDINSTYYYNLFVNYFEQQNGEWVQIPITNPPLSYRTPVITPNGQNKSLNGEITVKLSLYFDPNSAFDTIRLSTQLIDRSLNESNVVETGAMIKPGR